MELIVVDEADKIWERDPNFSLMLFIFCLYTSSFFTLFWIVYLWSQFISFVVLLYVIIFFSSGFRSYTLNIQLNTVYLQEVLHYFMHSIRNL